MPKVKLPQPLSISRENCVYEVGVDEPEILVEIFEEEEEQNKD